MAKWKCEICGNEFDNFHAQGFDNKIHCPLCYFKKENQQLKIQISARAEEYKKLEYNWNKLKEYIDIKLYNVEYLQKLCGCRIDDETHMILDIIKKEMQELEKGSDKE